MYSAHVLQCSFLSFPIVYCLRMTTLDFSLEELDVEHLHCKTASFSFYDGVLLQLRVPGMKNSTCFSRSLLRKCLYSLENGVSFTSIPGYTLGSFLVTTVCLSHQRHCLLHKRPRWLMSNTFLLAVGSSEEYRGTGRDRPRSRAARVLVLPSPEQSGGSRCRVEEGHE